MAYLERNAQIIAELNQGIAAGDIQLARRGRPAKNASTTTAFTPLGSFSSPLLGEEVYAGLKEYENGNSETRLWFDLSTINTIADTLPKLAPEVPVFFGLLVSPAGTEQGIITEDFSRGGIVRVDDADPRHDALLPHELAVISPGISDRELAKTSFFVGDTRRLGDFNTIARTPQARRSLGRFVEEIMDRQQEFTVYAALS